MLDTFTEAYHIRTVHRETIALVYGRNEPPLILFHRSVNAALGEGGAAQGPRE